MNGRLYVGEGGYHSWDGTGYEKCKECGRCHRLIGEGGLPHSTDRGLTQDNTHEFYAWLRKWKSPYIERSKWHSKLDQAEA